MNKLPGITIQYRKGASALSVDWNHIAFYPVTQITLEHGYAVLEGCIYNRSEEELQRELNHLLAHSDSNTIQHQVSVWDGEFVVILVNERSEEWVVFNDALGRLPLYLLQTPDEIRITRQFGELPRDLVSEDPLARAFGLLFGYPIGNRTIWKEVSKIPGNSIVRFRTGVPDEVFSLETEKQLFFSELPQQTCNSDELLELLEAACLNRLHLFPKTALSLSGGLDSRLLAGVFAKRNVTLPAVTYTAPEGHRQDRFSAVEITKRLGWSEPHLLELESTGQQESDRLFALKAGQNFLGMGFIIPFLDYFHHHHFAMLTGDGGDKTIECIHPMRPLKHMNDLWNYVVARHGIVSFPVIEKWCGVTEKELKAVFLDFIHSYPETQLDDKYARFVLTERGFNWLFEGEDRNRMVVWSTTPFYAMPFFKEAIKLNPNLKRDGALFRELFNKLPGKLGEVVNPNWMVALNDMKGLRKLMFRQRVKSVLPGFVTNRLIKKKTRKLTYSQWLASHQLRGIQHANWPVDESIELTDAGWWIWYTQLRQLTGQ